MTVRTRAVFAAAVACAPLVVLSACGTSGGSAEGARSTLQYVPATNYVLKEPATTTTTTTLAPGAETPAGGTSPSEQTYTIRSNDNLSKIAGQFDVEMQNICDYNGWSDCVNPPHLLLPGDEILIPPNAAVASSGGGTEVAAPADDSLDTADDGATEEAAAGEGCSYTIEGGDTPGRVAEDYDITFQQLQAANPSRDFQAWFLVGASINIPPEGDC